MKKTIFLIPVLVGLMIFALSKRKNPPTRPLLEERPVVRAFEVKAADYSPRIEGYGLCEPLRIWKGIAQVSGAITYVHPDLHSGRIFKQGTLILEIDPIPFQLKVEQIEIALKTLNLQRKELVIQEFRDKQSLVIEKELLALKEKDWKRQENLLKRGAASSSSQEGVKSSFLVQSSKVIGLEKNLEILANRRNILDFEETNLKLKKTEGELQLSYCKIIAPFTGLCGDSNLQMGQFLQAGTPLFTIQSIHEFKISAYFGNLQEFIPDFFQREKPPLDLDCRIFIPGDESSDFIRGFPLGLTEKVDPETKNQGLTLSLDSRNQTIGTGTLKLSSGMLCRVELHGKLKPQILLPKSVVQQGKVLVVEKDGTLISRKVEVQSSERDFYLVLNGLSPGEWVVLSQLEFTTPGMKVQIIKDQKFLNSFKGGGSL